MTVCAEDAFAVQLDVPIADAGDAGVEQHFDMELLLQLPARALRELLRVRRQDPRAGLDEHYTGQLRIDVAKIGLERVVRQLGDGSRGLDAGGAGADDDERHRAATADLVVVLLGLLERRENTPPDLDRVNDALQAGRERLPLGVAEVGVTRARGDNQVVILDATARGDHLARVGEDLLHERHRDDRVLLVAQDGPNRFGDVGGRELRVATW